MLGGVCGCGEKSAFPSPPLRVRVLNTQRIAALPIQAVDFCQVRSIAADDLDSSAPGDGWDQMAESAILMVGPHPRARMCVLMWAWLRRCAAPTDRMA